MVGKLGLAKNGMMGGMPLTEQVLSAHHESKVEIPKAIEEVDALFTKGAALSEALAKHNLKLDFDWGRTNRTPQNQRR